MRVTPRAPSLALLASLLACEEDRAALDFSQLDEPERVCVELVHDPLEVEGSLVAFVSDAPGSSGGWALVSTTIDDAQVLALRRVPADASERATAPIVVSNDPFDAPNFELRAGLERGDAWLLREVDQDQGPVVLRRLRPGVGVQASNASLANFPADASGEDCPHRWTRQLLLIEGRPYMLATPDCAEGPALELELLELDPESLDFLTNWSLSFDPCLGLDPELCAQAYTYRLVAIARGQSTQLPGASRTSVALAQTAGYDAIGDTSPLGLATSLSRLDLRIGTDGPDARLLTIRDVWYHVAPLQLGVIELARDAAAQQIYAPLLGTPLESVLVRIDAISDSYVAAPGDVLPTADSLALVQLAHESALMWIDQGRLRASSLIDVAVWGSFEAQTLVDDADLIGFESAGPGMLVLRRQAEPDQVLHLACLE